MTSLKDVYAAAAELPEQDRATLAGLLLTSLDAAPDPGVEAAWSEEIKRRCHEVDSGAVQIIPWDQVQRELFGRRRDPAEGT
jgi:putative addiction module component (TIGR02574 family)